jgi:hypothetical protein
MATYKNEYTQDEDQVLWEIHEIRHEIHSEIEKKGIAALNEDAKELLKKWKSQYSHRTSKTAS